MVIYKAKNYQDMSRKAANLISAQIIMKPNCVLGLATGSSPVGTYKQLIEWYEKGDLDFSQVTSINLDEYKGLSPENDQSYRYFMNTNLFNHVNIDKTKTFVPDGLEPDSKKPAMTTIKSFRNKVQSIYSFLVLVTTVISDLMNQVKHLKKKLIA